MTKIGLSGKIASSFLQSKLTPLLVIAFLLAGSFAVFTTPREEEPQIVVPMIDIFVPFPGASAQETEERVAKPLEKKMSEIKGVEYVYSMSQPGMAIVTVRFVVGHNVENALVLLYNKIMSNMDAIPPGAGQPLVKPKSIDDVPILALTLWSKEYGDYDLRRVAAVLEDEIRQIPQVGEVDITGGRSREIRVLLQADRLAGYQLNPGEIMQTLQSANVSLPAGGFQQLNREFLVRTGQLFESVKDVGNVMVGAYQGKPVYLKDVATISDGPGEIKDYVLFGAGPAHENKSISLPGDDQRLFPGVTISVSKQKGTNAVTIAEEVNKKVESLRGKVIPQGMELTITRNYGETAKEKANELIEHLLIATASVILLIAVFLGAREAMVIGVAVPVTLAIALFLSELFGYTLNRVTLFALIFAIGILVDDAIVVVENIHRWFSMCKLPPVQATVRAVDEVGNPTILATFTVVAVLLPMAFVGGLMGPYMAPIPINASVAMLFSLLVAFIVTPWFAFRFHKRGSGVHSSHGHDNDVHIDKNNPVAHFYQRIMKELLNNRIKRWSFLLGVVILLMGSFLMVYTKAVGMKMLPFDNKSEFQIVIDMPEGSPLERTSELAKAIGDYVSTVNEVTDYQIYVGTHSPFNFNGLVRHYYLREGSNLADIQVNLIDKNRRSQQSHDIAKRIRPQVQEIGNRYGAKSVKVVEIPPGPPVLSPLVTEIYGPNLMDQLKVAKQVKDIFSSTPGVVDVDWYVEDDQTEYKFIINDKAHLHGITEDQIVQTVRLALNGAQVGLVHAKNELEPVALTLQFPIEERSSLTKLQEIRMPAQDGSMVPLSELVTMQETQVDKTRYRKNQQRVVYVVGDMAGKAESPVYGVIDMYGKIGNITLSDGSKLVQHLTKQPDLTEKVSLKWDGEWQITYEVFRDLGIAFGVGLVIMYLLIVGWFQSFRIPLVIMSPIPLTLVGIFPGHWLMGAFFTATSMIGFIALAGIIVRNSILLVEFSQRRMKEGVEIKQALVEAGVVRAKPIILTAAAVIVGAFVILFDPIFQGLAISLIFGTLAATIMTLFIIPVLYYMVGREKNHVSDNKEDFCQ